MESSANMSIGRRISDPEKEMRYTLPWGIGSVVQPIATLPLRLVNGMDIKSWFEKLRPGLLDVRERGLYCRKMIAAGTTVKKGIYNLFDKTKNDTDKSLDGTLSITSLLGWTNMVENGKVPGGHNFIAESLQVGVLITTREYSGLDANIQLPSGGINAAAADTKAATNDWLALKLNSKVTLSEPDYGEYASGPITRFPSPQVPLAAFGGATNEGFICNGGPPRYFRFIKVFQEMHHFDVVWEFYCDTAFTHNVYLEVLLDGFDTY